MLFEVGSTIIMAGVAGYAYLQTKGTAIKDADKIRQIFNNAGWQGKGGETIRLQKKRKIEGGTEYVYQLPLGFDRKDIENHAHILEDGLNVRSKTFDFQLSDLKELKFDKNIVQQIQTLLKPKRKNKEIEIEFDGMLKIKVYNEKMKDSYDWNEKYLKSDTISVSIGVTRQGVVRHDFDEHKHLIISGATGYGKSAIQKLIITSLVLQMPDDVKLHLIDLKGGSAFQRFKNLKQTIHFTQDPEGAKEILQTVQEEINQKYKDIVDQGFEDIKESGKKERHFIIIDEAADIVDDKARMEIVTDIARRGRGAGYYLIYSTQFPSIQAIPQQTKRNIPSRLCFVLDDATASNTDLGQTGAESLPLVPGRGIYKNVKSQVVQTPYITNKEIDNRIGPHIIIKTKGDDNGQKSSQTTENRKHTLNITKA